MQQENPEHLESPDFNLPRHTLDEECHQEYEDVIIDGVHIKREIPKMDKSDSGGTPGYHEEEAINRSISLATNFAKVQHYYDNKGRKKMNITAPKTAWIHNLIYLNGSKFDFRGRDYLRPIYNNGDKRILLCTARQVEKSTLLANNLAIMCTLKPFFRCLYVSPSHIQTRTFSNDKLKPVLERSPIIAKYFQNTKISTQVFEKGFTNGSFIFLRSAFLSADRCLPEDTPILTDNLTEKKLSEINVGDVLPSFDNGKFTFNKVIGKNTTGEKECFEYTLENGLTLASSENHKHITHSGVVKTKDLTKDHYIPVAFNRYSYFHSEDLAILIGLLLSDGCLLAGSRSNDRNYYKCEFNNNDLSLIKLFETIALKYNFKTHIHSRKVSNKNNYTVRLSPQSKVKELLQPLEILGTGSFTSFIPPSFFSFPTKLKGVLQGLFEGDGWCCYNPKNNQAEVGIISASLQMVQDIQKALLLFGIYSIVKTKKIKEEKRSICYVLKIRKTYYIERFFERIGFINKNIKLEKIVNEIKLLDKNLSRRLDIPFRSSCMKALFEKGISTHKLWVDHRISLRENRGTNDRISYHKAYKILNLTNNLELSNQLNEDFIWLKIKNISSVGIKNTIDLEIENSESFIANYCVTHNSRGISSDALCIDELQDIIMSNIPVIAQCLSHSSYKYQIFAGTPKSLDNTIQQMWETTSQNEWMVKCHGCNKYNYLGIENIGKHGPICKKCGKDLNVAVGQWMSAKQDAFWSGYRIPQLMVPWIAKKDSDAWKEILYQMEHYPESQFYNEVLGISYDSASKPITRGDVLACCSVNNKLIEDPYHLSESDKVLCSRLALCAGVDWGEGNDGAGKDIMGRIKTASYTILTVGGFNSLEKYQIVYMKRYEGKEIDPEYIVQDVVKICFVLGVKMIGVDWGHGWGVNNKLFRMFGAKRCIQYMYVDQQKETRKWDAIGYKMQLMRNFVMSEIFFMFKEEKMLCPPLEKWEHFAKDMFNISVEYVEYQRKLRYIHRPSDPDDWFHSLLYSVETAKIYLGKR